MRGKLKGHSSSLKLLLHEAILLEVHEEHVRRVWSQEKERVLVLVFVLADDAVVGQIGRSEVIFTGLTPHALTHGIRIGLNLDLLAEVTRGGHNFGMIL